MTVSPMASRAAGVPEHPAASGRDERHEGVGQAVVDLLRRRREGERSCESNGRGRQACGWGGRRRGGGCGGGAADHQAGETRALCRVPRRVLDLFGLAHDRLVERHDVPKDVARADLVCRFRVRWRGGAGRRQALHPGTVRERRGGQLLDDELDRVVRLRFCQVIHELAELRRQLVLVEVGLALSDAVGHAGGAGGTASPEAVVPRASSCHTAAGRAQGPPTRTEVLLFGGVYTHTAVSTSIFYNVHHWSLLLALCPAARRRHRSVGEYAGPATAS